MRYFFASDRGRRASGRTMTVGCRFSSGESVTTSCDMPVTSSTCSCMVMPSIRSLKCTTPLTSVRIENVYGSHSSRIWLALHRRAVVHQNARAVDHRVAFFLAALIVHDRDDAVAVHGDQLALGVAATVSECRCNLTKPSDLASCVDCSADPRGRSADVERTHGQLRARLADGLRRDHADRFAALHQPSGGQVAAVAELTQTPRFDSQVSTERILTRSIPAA